MPLFVLTMLVRTIAARPRPRSIKAKDPQSMDCDEDVLRPTPLGSGTEQISPVTGLPGTVASPKVQQLFNIFHPSDPISYRLEPLISPAMSTLKPQLLPYTKRGIFSNVTPQGLTGIGTMVGQSVSGLWSSLSAGIASNLINRTLGFNSEQVARITASASRGEPQTIDGLGPKALTSGDTPEAVEKRVATDARIKKLADSATNAPGLGPGLGDHSPTLIDDELETLYSKFQQGRTQMSKEGETTTTSDEDTKARKLHKEEGKVRALNRNGRVDYSIQE